MKKKYLFLILTFLFVINLYGQQIPINKQWDKTLGSSNSDILFSSLRTADGGFLLGGYSYSDMGGDKSANCKGASDFWIIKLDFRGNKIWDKTYGSDANDFLTSMLATPDEGFLLGGYSNGNKNNKGGFDYWIIKIDKEGHQLWEKSLGGDDNDKLTSIVMDTDNNFILGGFSYSNQSGDKDEDSRGENDYWVIKIDQNGNKLWDKTLGGIDDDRLSSMLTTADNNILLGGFSYSNQNDDKSENNIGGKDYWLIELDENGNKLWDKTLGGAADDDLKTMLITQDNNFLLGGFSYSNQSGDKSGNNKGKGDCWVIKVDNRGNKLWDKTIGGNKQEDLSTMLNAPDGGILLGGYSYSNINGDKSEVSKGVSDFWLVKIDDSGLKLWDKAFGGKDFDAISTMLATLDGGFLLGGYSYSNQGGDKSENSKGGDDYWIVKLGKEITYPNLVSGIVFQDQNNNSIQDSNELPLTGWVIKAQSTSNTFYALSDSLGKYTLFLDKDTYTISQITPNNGSIILNNQVYPTQPYSLIFNSLGKDTTGFNFGLNVNTCATLKVDVSSNPRRRCFQGQTIITYQNAGLTIAQNVQLEVDFPEYVIPLSSTTTWSSNINKTLTFQIGTLLPGEQKRIVITDSVACVEQVRGMSQCVEVRISPKNSCVVPNPDWNGANLELSGKCLLLAEPVVQIIFKNTGIAAMTQASQYRIFADDSLLLASTVQLIAGDSLVLEFPTQGFNIRVEAEQVPSNPNSSLLSIDLQDCNLVSNRFANQFLQFDENLEKEIDCQVVRDSFDPNDKLVSPEGITNNHYVKPDTRLEYTLRFQNTGTAKAINIEVIDSLSTNLNFETFEMMSASHSYQLEVRGSQKQVLVFKFSNINLPDSTSNKAQSQGFVKFKISPKANLATGTIVKNFADIYFDYNEPIRTNVTEINYTDYQFPTTKSLQACQIKGYAPAKPIISQNLGENKLICDIKEGNYQWYRNGLLINQNTQVIEVSQSGEYEVIVSKNDCTSEKSEKFILDICKTNSYKFKKPEIFQMDNDNKLKVDINNAQYEWYRNGNLISQNTQVIEITQSGDYEVIVNKNECYSEKSNKFKFVISNSNKFETATEVSIYPNPSQGNLTLKMTNITAKDLNVKVLHSSGKVVWQNNFSTDIQPDWQTQVNLSHLPNGLYFLEIQNTEEKVVKKIIIEK